MTQPDRHFDDLDPRATQPPASLLSRTRHFCYALIVAGAVGCLFGWLINPVQFHFSYLAAWCWGWTVLMGILFFVLLHHLTDAGWSTVVRRPAEAFLAAMPVLALLFIPILIGILAGKTHTWIPQSQLAAAHLQSPSPASPSPAADASVTAPPAPKVDEHDLALLAGKRPYLNIPFFLARQIVYFAVWLFLAWKLRRNSLAQDVAGEARYTRSSRRVSAVGILLYALTFTFASFDWLMSLDWRWFSTIYGVYTWAGAVCGGLAALTLLALALSAPRSEAPGESASSIRAKASGGILRQYIGSDTRYTLGELLFAFCVFWAYIAFSQYFLVWYGNIPEETTWFLRRWTGAEGSLDSRWWTISVLLPVGRFVLPFFILMSALAKRHRRTLGIMSALTLCFAWLDLYWLIMPAHDLSGPPLRWLWIDAAALALILGCCGVVILRALRSAPLYPIMDPRLVESLSAEHVEEISAADIE